MPDTPDREPLSFGDALFLHLERPGMPLHVASLTVFDGAISLRDCRRYVASRLHLVPRYTQRVAPPPFNLGLPVWQPDPSFDLRHHVREVRLKRGTGAEMKSVASRLLSANMRRDRPLWDFTLLQGLEGNRTAMLIRVHHCLADGISGVGLLNAMLDPDPKASFPARAKSRAAAPPAAPLEPSVLESFFDSCFSTVDRVLNTESQLLAMAQHALAAARAPHGAAPPLSPHGGRPTPSLDQLNDLLPQLLAPAERLPFNRVCRGPQRFELAEIPVAEIKALKRAAGVTFNDAVLAIVTAALARYARLHQVSLHGRSLRIVIPVSMRNGGDARLGNNISFVPVSIPLDLRRPRDLIAAVHERTELLKGAHVAELIGLAGSLLGVLPGPFQAALGPIASQLPLSLCNLICTDVPGPQDALYLFGHKLLACYPYVPIGGEMGVNIAVLTYNGVAYFGFTSDVHAIPDVARLPGFLRAAFSDLQQDVLPRTRRSAAERKKRDVQKAEMQMRDMKKRDTPKRAVRKSDVEKRYMRKSAVEKEATKPAEPPSAPELPTPPLAHAATAA